MKEKITIYFNLYKHDLKMRLSIRTDRFVYQCWQGPIPSGQVIFHRNGNNNDDSIGNLELIPVSHI